MQVTIKVTCFSCGNEFDHYFKLRKSHEDVIKCPYCYLEVDHQAQEMILTAAGQYSDALHGLYNHADGHKLPLFQFNLLTTYVDPKKISNIHGI